MKIKLGGRNQGKTGGAMKTLKDLKQRNYQFYSGNDIKAMRQRAGCTQKEAALLVGVDQQSVQKWEKRGEMPCHNQTAAELLAIKLGEHDIYGELVK